MKTFILKWNPAISSVSMDDMKWLVFDAYDSLDDEFNWSIREWEKAEKGDRVFMLRVGRGKVGIMASGWLSSDPYEDDDWRGGTDRRLHYADIRFDVLIYPLRNNVLDTKMLQREIPSVDWKGGHSGVLISEEEGIRLEEVWRQFLAENKPQFAPDAGNTFQSLLVRAWGIAFNAHKGQVDKGGKDYFEAHVIKVYDNVVRLYDDDNNCVTEIVALLHDVVEDTDWTIERLRLQGFTDEMLEALQCVTRQDGESYDHFIERLKPNRYARAVKIADLKSNMDITRLNEITDEDVERLRKYHRAYKTLMAEENEE